MRVAGSVTTILVLIAVVMQPFLASAQPVASPTVVEQPVTLEPAGDNETPSTDADMNQESPAMSPGPGIIVIPDDEEPTEEAEPVAEEFGTIVFNVTMPAEDPDGVIMVEMENLTGAFYYDYIRVSTGDTYELPAGTYAFAWYGDGYFSWRGTFEVVANETISVDVTPQVEAYGTITFDVRMPNDVPDPRVRIIISSFPAANAEQYESFDSDGSFPVTFTLPAGTWYWRTSAMGMTRGATGTVEFTLGAGDNLQETIVLSATSTARPVIVDVNPSPDIDLSGQIACIYPATDGTYWARRCITLDAAGIGNFGPLGGGNFIVALNENGLYPLQETPVTVNSGSPTNLVIPWNRTAGGTVTFNADFPDGMDYAFVFIETASGGYVYSAFLYANQKVSLSLPVGDYRYAFNDPFAVMGDYTYFSVADNGTYSFPVTGSRVTLDFVNGRNGELNGFSVCVVGMEFGVSKCSVVGPTGGLDVGLLAPGQYTAHLSGGDTQHPDGALSFVVGSTGSTVTIPLTWPMTPFEMAIAPISGRAGADVTATGSGFAPHEVVTVTWGEWEIRSLTADNAGTITTTLTIPAWAGMGAQDLMVVGSSGRTSTLVYTVTELSDPVITLGPASGKAGTLTLISGNGFVPGELITIRWGGASGVVLRSFNAGTTGAFTANTTVPLTAGLGTYSVHVSSASGRSGSADYTVTELGGPVVTLGPASGKAGSITLISGNGFVPGELITIRWGGASGVVLRSFNAGASGAFTANTAVPLNAGLGAYTVHVSSASGRSGSAIYTVTELAGPVITLSPASGKAGTNTLISGSGFAPGELITIRWGGETGVVLRSFNAGTTGAFTANTIVPLNAGLGSYSVYVSSASGKSGSATYTVNQLAAPVVTLAPTNGKAGTNTLVSGNGFAPGELITIRWGGASGAVLRSFNAGASGAFTANTTIPLNAGTGSYTVYVQSASGNVGTATYTVTQPAAPVVTLSPTSGRAGTTTLVSGNGFVPGELITIRWGGASGVVLRSFNAGTTGAFTANITVPATASLGSYTVHVRSASAKTGTATYTVTQVAVQSVWREGLIA